jgi:hypothetical protein
LELPPTELDRSSASRVEVIDVQVEVHLLLLSAVRPFRHRTP